MRGVTVEATCGQCKAKHAVVVAAPMTLAEIIEAAKLLDPRLLHVPVPVSLGGEGGLGLMADIVELRSGGGPKTEPWVALVLGTIHLKGIGE